MVTVYVTAVERFYGGATETATGCLSINCGYHNDTFNLGASLGFVRQAHDEVIGLVTSARTRVTTSTGPLASARPGTGWTPPRDSFGGALCQESLRRRTHSRVASMFDWSRKVDQRRRHAGQRPRLRGCCAGTSGRFATSSPRGSAARTTSTFISETRPNRISKPKVRSGSPSSRPPSPGRGTATSLVGMIPREVRGGYAIPGMTRTIAPYASKQQSAAGSNRSHATRCLRARNECGPERSTTLPSRRRAPRETSASRPLAPW